MSRSDSYSAGATEFRVSGSVAGATSATLGTLVLEANASNLSPLATAQVDSYADSGFVPFILSPMSSVTFTADASVVASFGTATPPAWLRNFAYSETLLRVAANNTWGYPVTWGRASHTLGDSSQPGATTMSVTYENPYASEVALFVSLSATATANVNQVLPVPEPSTYVLLGLGLLTLAGRQKLGPARR